MHYFKAVRYRRWMNALIILNEGDASVFIKDNEYFYNPIEWIILMNKDNKALNPLLEDLDTTTTTIEDILPKPQKASNLNDVYDNLDVLSTNNDFQRDFQLTRSHTTWYGIPNPYHELNSYTQSKCEHIPYKNYSTDHQNSTFTPAIFTPRKNTRFNTAKILQRPPDGSSTQEIIEFAYYDQENDVRTILKLMDKVQEKMTLTHSYSTSLNSVPSSAVKSLRRTSARTQNTQNTQNSQVPLTPNRITERGPVFITSAKSIPSSPFLPTKAPQAGNDKRMLQQFILKQQEGLFLPDISNSAKILASQPKQKSAVKDQLHNIYEFYSDQETLIGFVPINNNSNFYINKANEQYLLNNQNHNNINNNNQNNQTINMASSILDGTTNNNDTNSKQIDQPADNLLNRKPKKSIIALSADAPNGNKTKEVKFSLKNK